MPVIMNKPAPYAPPSVVLGIIGRYRERGLPSPITVDVLVRAGVSESLAGRTLQALQALDLIDEDGNVTSILDKIRLAPQSDFQQRLIEWLNTAYADVLQFVDPSKDGEEKIRDAFRNYQPIGQQSRMVILFMGLYAAAGVTIKKSEAKTASANLRVSPQPQTRKIFTSTHAQRVKASISQGLPPQIEGLLKGLPSERVGWSQAQRDKFIIAFGAVLDLCIPITETVSPIVETDDEEDRE